MSFRHPCISFVAIAVVIVAGTISTAGTLPSVSMTVTENIKDISKAIHELTKAVVDQQSYKSLQAITEALQSHQTPVSQIFLKSVGTPPPQCQTVNYELAAYIVLKAVESAADQVAHLEDRLQKVETIASLGLEVPPDLEDKLQNLSQAVQLSVNQVANFDQRLQEVETIISHTQDVSHNIEDKLQAQVKEEDEEKEEKDARSKGSCRSPFYQVGDDCLFVDYVRKASWEKARKFCRAFGGDLIVPSDVLKLGEFISVFGVDTWIGGSDLLKKGEWRWLNGSEVDLSAGWAPGQPEEYVENHCLHYWGYRNWLLKDGTCSVGLHFVCQDAIYAQ